RRLWRRKAERRRGPSVVKRWATDGFSRKFRHHNTLVEVAGVRRIMTPQWVGILLQRREKNQALS
ncbi:MAG: hypothetical protein VXX06_09380, partial [Pseudomonadota bacterium]|nr:hypothetical protein [Pseudomonadota bacterium]